MLQSETVRKYDTYKDSGIEWIGKVPHEWNVLPHKYIMSKVKNICEKYDGEDIISLTMKGVIKRDLDNPMGKMPLTFDGYQRIETGNLLLCLFDIDVTPRCVGLIKDDGLTSPAYSQFKFLGQDCPQYYTYLLTMIDDDKCFLHLAKNLRSSLTEDNFGAILTIQPPFEEQQQIADYLDKKCEDIDKVVETEKSVIEKLKEYKQSIITEAVTKGLGKSVPLKDSGIEWIGKIPQHWDVLSLARIANIVRGASPRPAGDPMYFCGNFCPWITVAEVTKDDSKYIFETEEYLTELGVQHSKLIDENTFLLSNSGATLGVPKITKIKGCINDGSLAFLDISCNMDYLYYVLKSRTNEFRKQMQGYGQPNLNTTIVKAFKICLPSTNEQIRIAEYLDKKCSEIDKAIANNEQVIEKFTEYKKSLIYECVTGKRKVVK